MRTHVRLETRCSTVTNGVARIAVDDEPLARHITARTGDDVTVSEVATYAFCAKAWHLEHALRHPASRNSLGRRAAGTALHQEHGAELIGARPTGTRLVFWSILLLGLAAILLVLGLFATR